MHYYSRVRKKFKPGETIFSENSESDGMYIVESGSVRVFTRARGSENDVDIELCTLGPNSMFGEMALIDNGRRSASVQAIEQTVCTVITKKMFEHQIERIPSWMVNMIRILVIRLRETNERLREIIQDYSAPPVDTGTMIMIPDEKSAPPDKEQCTEEMKNYLEMKSYYKDKIIQELEGMVSESRSGTDRE
jgi:CRP-like cAMP-binding protein